MIAEKILIHEDVKAYKVQIADLQQYAPGLDKLLNTWNALELGEFPTEGLKEILSSTDKVEQDYNKKLNNQLDRANVTVPSMRKQLINGCQQEMADFLNVVLELKEFTPKRSQTENYPILPLSSISFDGKDFVISDPEKVRLREQFRIYIDSEEEAKLYEAMQQLKPAYKAFFEAVKQSGILPRVKIVNSHHVNLGVLFNAKEDGSLEINPHIFSFIKHTLKFKNN